MTQGFTNPWTNPHDPVKIVQRYRRRRAKRKAQETAQTAPPQSPDHRDNEVNENRSYATQTSNKATAQQQRMHDLLNPWADFWQPGSGYDPNDW